MRCPVLHHRHCFRHSHCITQHTDIPLHTVHLSLTLPPSTIMALALPSLTTIAFYLVLSVLLYYTYHLTHSLVIRPYRRYTLLKQQGVASRPFTPLIGDLPRIRKYEQTDRVLYMGKDLSERYGPVVQYMLGPFNVLQLTDPDYVLAAWKTQHSHYHKG